MILIKIDQSLLNGHYGATRNVPGWNFFKNISSSKKELPMEMYKSPWKDNTFQFVFYLDLSLLYVLLIKIVQCFTNERYRSNQFVCDSNFLKTFETEIKASAFNENLTGSLKRKIMVKPCCAWYNFSINF